jgi:uncharacterized protein (TIGR02147 family)
MNNTTFSIFNYQDPSQFLRDAWHLKRQNNQSFTVRAWAHQLGINSHGSFYQIIRGQRALPKNYVQPLSKSLNLTPKESLYLETLVEFHKAKSGSLKAYYKARLKELSPTPSLSFYEIETFHYLKNPLNGAIIELTNLQDFKFDAVWIKDRLQIGTSINEIQRSIELLLELGLLKKEEDGSIKRVHQNLHTKQDIQNEALQEYHHNVLKIAQEQISKQVVSKREYNATAMGIKKKDIPVIKERIRDFLKQFIAEFETPEGQAEEIYQFAIQFFALTDTKEKLQ